VIAGIIGTEIVRYDIYGSDVVTANNMESHGKEGNIMVSETTKRLLETDPTLKLEFEFREDVLIKSTGKNIKGYLIISEAEI